MDCAMEFIHFVAFQDSPEAALKESKLLPRRAEGSFLFRVSDGSNFESTKKQITFPVDGDYHFLLLRLKKSLFSNNFQYDLINFLLATLFDRKRSNRKPEQSRLYLLSMWFLLDICVDNSKCCVLLIRILVFSQSEAEFNINDSQRTRV